MKMLSFGSMSEDGTAIGIVIPKSRTPKGRKRDKVIVKALKNNKNYFSEIAMNIKLTYSFSCVSF